MFENIFCSKRKLKNFILPGELLEYFISNEHNRYLRITVTGILSKNSMIKAIRDTMTHPEYNCKHSFWDCSDASMGMSLIDLKEIVGIFRLYKPEKSTFANRVAILLTGNMNEAMVSLLIPMTRVLPFKFKLFTNHEKAEKFLIQD